MIQLREPPEAPGWMPGVVRVRSLLGTFWRDQPPETDPVHTLVRRFRAGDDAATAAVLRAGRAAIGRDAARQSASMAAVVVPGHEGSLHPGLIGLVDSLAGEAGWTVPTAEVLVRHTPIAQAKQRPLRDPPAEAASLRARPAIIPPSIEAILLVDDVYASGSTLAACVAALRRDGWAGHVAALVVAVGV